MSSTKHIRTIKDVQKEIVTNENFKDKLVSDPVGTIDNLTGSSWSKDKWIYRLVVGILGITILIIVIGILILYKEDTDIPSVLIATVSTALGAIAGLLAPQPNQE